MGASSKREDHAFGIYFFPFLQAAIWEMEERQLHERHQLAKRQLKDLFFLQRHQMLVHHEKELEHLKRMMDRKEEELIKNQTQERKALPKRIRQEMKAREMMFRESMRISTTNLHETLKPVEEKDRLKKVCTAVCLQFFTDEYVFYLTCICTNYLHPFFL